MKISKETLRRIIKEEIADLSGPTAVPNKDPLSGPTAAPNKDPLSGPTAVDADGSSIKQKAVALDKVEALLTKLVKQLRSL
jgi:hypothetical protein